MVSRNSNMENSPTVPEDPNFDRDQLVQSIPELVGNHVGSRYKHNYQTDWKLVLKNSGQFHNLPEERDELTKSLQLWRVTEELLEKLNSLGEIVGNVNRTNVWARTESDSSPGSSVFQSIAETGDLPEREERFEQSKEERLHQSHTEAYDTEVNPRIWVGDAGTQDNKEPHGEWIFNLENPDTLRREIKRILTESPVSGDEFYILDAEGFGGALSLLGSLENLNNEEQLDNLAALVRGINLYGRPFAEYAQLLGARSIQDPEKALNSFKDAYYGQYDTRVGCARDYLQATGKWVENPNIDPLDYADELFDEMGGSGFMISRSGYVFYEHV